MTFLEAEKLFAKAKNKLKGKPIARNTRIMKVDDDCYAILYHNTFILKIYSNGHYQYNTGGWYSVTTKQRMNQYGPLSIFSVKGKWYARYKNETIPYFNRLSTKEWETKSFLEKEIEKLDALQANEALVGYNDDL